MDNSNFLLPNDHPHLEVLSFSHRGLVRENNEDNLLIQSFQTNQPNPQHVLLAILADGVGGHQAGEVASRIGVETIAAVISACSNLNYPDKILEEAFIAANREIVEQAQANEDFKGMGSTSVSALVVERKLYLANLGDSRLYRIRHQVIQQLTFDHTWLAELSGANFPGAGKITRSHPLAHVLNRYLGSPDPIHVDLRIRVDNAESEEEMRQHQGLELVPQDILLLSSDGISDLLTDQEIKECVMERKWNQAARRLVYGALKKGGHDNASVILIRVPQTSI